MLGNKIALGQIDSAIAAGVDTVSDPPVVYPQGLSAALAQELSRQERGCSGSAPWLGLRLKHLRPVLPGIAEPRTGLSMGESTELMVKTWGIGRAEQDQLALESHQKAAAAYADGFYQDLVREYLGLSRDNNIRERHAVSRSYAKLKPGVRYLGCRQP